MNPLQGAGRFLHSRSLLRAFYVVNLGVILLVLGYKGYLIFLDEQPQGANAIAVESIQQQAAGKAFTFAVAGNINNSIGIFERRMIPLINQSGADFVVSVGNAVSGGGEDRYRALQKTLERLEKPFLMSFGENEESGIGSLWFYERFGPYFFSFDAYNARFIFLDVTGKTPYTWQFPWLEDQLRSAGNRPVFVFTSNPLRPPVDGSPHDAEFQLVAPESARRSLLDLVEQDPVVAVFTAGGKWFSEHTDNGVRHVMTGAAGGFLPHSSRHDYHFLEVRFDGEAVAVEPVMIETARGPIAHTLESAWLAAHAVIYSGYLVLLVVLAVALLILSRLHRILFTERDFYPASNVDPERYKRPPVRVAMMTNSFLPFAGGVPISIDRLRQGLEQLGHEVLVVAPRYPEATRSSAREVRLPTLWRGRGRQPFVVANPFRRQDRARIRSFAPDVIHVHHPFWVGSLGLWMGRRLNVPVVWTYHTRLEHYSHYVPVPGRLFRNFIAHYMVRRFANRCDLVIVPTQSAETYLRTIDVTAPVLVQPTGIDIHAAAPPDPQTVQAHREALGLQGKRVLISVSRLGKEKNLLFLLEGFRQVSRSHSEPVHLLLIGEGPFRPVLERRITQLGLEAQVTLVGRVSPDRVRDYYGLADLFVFASRSETQGMVLLEAMAFGLPVVAVRASGVNDVMRNEQTGYLTDENPEEWAARSVDLLQDAARYKRMSAEAIELARQFSLERVARTILDGYARVRALRDPG